MDINFIKSVDSEIAAVISKEFYRQKNNLELIASENFTSEAILAAKGAY